MNQHQDLKQIILELARLNSLILSSTDVAAIKADIICLLSEVQQIFKINTAQCAPLQFPHQQVRFNYLRPDQADSVTPWTVFAHNAPLLVNRFVFLPAKRAVGHELKS